MSEPETAIKVLIVEDSPGDVFFVERMLTEACAGTQSFEITDVPRLVDAFHLADKHSYDVVLLDLNLLDIDGVAAVAALHAEIPSTPIIVYSGAENIKLQEAALMCGASAYLVKGHADGKILQQAIANHTGDIRVA